MIGGLHLGKKLRDSVGLHRSGTVCCVAPRIIGWFHRIINKPVPTECSLSLS